MPPKHKRKQRSNQPIPVPRVADAAATRTPTPDPAPARRIRKRAQAVTFGKVVWAHTAKARRLLFPGMNIQMYRNFLVFFYNHDTCEMVIVFAMLGLIGSIVFYYQLIKNTPRRYHYTKRNVIGPSALSLAMLLVHHWIVGPPNENSCYCCPLMLNAKCWEGIGRSIWRRVSPYVTPYVQPLFQKYVMRHIEKLISMY